MVIKNDLMECMYYMWMYVVKIKIKKKRIVIALAPHDQRTIYLVKKDS